MSALHSFGSIAEPVVLWTADYHPVMTFLILAIFFLFGLYSLYSGFDLWRTSRLIMDTPTEKVGSMAAGRTELSGTVKDCDQTTTAPFTTDECVYVESRYEVRKTKRRNGKRRKMWVTEQKSKTAYDFTLADETGDVLIRTDDNPEYKILNDTHTVRKTYRSGQSLPTDLQRYLSDPDSATSSDSNNAGALQTVSDIVSSVGKKSNKARRRRYTQSILPVDSQVYVFGSAEPPTNDDQDANYQNRLEIREDEATDTFIVSDSPEATVATRYRHKSWAEIIFGLVCSTAALYLLLTWSHFPVSL